MKQETIKVCVRFAWLPLVLVLASAAGCGGGSSSNPDGGDGFDMDGCQGGGQRLLSVVGSPNREMHPGEQIDLAVALIEKCVGAVAGETVQFEILQNPGGASLSADTAVTSDMGVAQVTLSVAPGEQISDTTFGVHVTHVDDPDGVFFTITLKPILHQLAATGPLGLECYVGESLQLEVRVTDLYTNAPVRGVEVGFSIPNPPPGGDASLQDAKTITNLSGVANNVFNCGSVPVQYSVVAEGVTEVLEKVSFTITVKSRQQCASDDDCPSGFTCVSGACQPAGGSDCQSDDDCPDGYSCERGVCRPDGALPDSCETHADCPPGYYCEGHECYPCPEESTIPECQGGAECETDDDCPPGFICVNGFCQPDNPPDVVVPELGGRWYTRHFFDTSGALGGATVADIIETLDQVINYCNITGIGFIDDLLCDVIDQYVPDWVGTLIGLFNNLFNMLHELRAEGTMELVHLNPRELVSGTEQWDTIFIRYPQACCECGPRGEPGNCCNPHDNPDWPDCATIDINRTDMDFADVGLEVTPFTGKIQVDDSGPVTKYTLLIDPRTVRMEYSKFVAMLLDLLIDIFTGYDNLEDALMDIIDCEAIGDSVEGWCEDWGFGSWFNCSDVGDSTEQACDNFKPQADDLIRGLLDQIGIDWKYLNFTGHATITVEDDNPPYGTFLGTPDFEQTKDGIWQGDVTIITNSSMEGAWYGER
ncbi:MAG: hypothetical protein DRI34_00435 [Deltaproteobacteria bacterium]|nr:MAG: hypothetical protein DRI34_00435 [Deltaproteobacteria bacterium]